MKKVIIYYSLEGNTDMLAKQIAKKVSADIIKLVPEKEIPKTGFKKFFWGGKSAIFNEKPKLTNGKIDLSAYDTVIIGTPIWAGTFTPPINTFLTDEPMQGKNIYLFACHGGGGAEKCFSKLEARLTGNTVKGKIDFENAAKDQPENISKRLESFCNAIIQE